jgi:hypothetical protein
VAERPPDPLTIEAFVTTEATFPLRGDTGTAELRCRRTADAMTFEASATPATFVLRLHHAPSASTASADGRPLARVEPAALEHNEHGWAIDNTTAIVKARARMIEIR